MAYNLVLPKKILQIAKTEMESQVEDSYRDTPISYLQGLHGNLKADSISGAHKNALVDMMKLWILGLVWEVNFSRGLFARLTSTRFDC